ncbi:hypothetical protein KM043_016039 [Ampulex compressa]|nr:hypothetical protein KM043_016039 [Ampulex compressa]
MCQRRNGFLQLYLHPSLRVEGGNVMERVEKRSAYCEIMHGTKLAQRETVANSISAPAAEVMARRPGPPEKITAKTPGR